MITPTPEVRASLEKKFVFFLMIGAAFLAVLPELLVLLSGGSGWYLGKQTNIDDHMVYAAWMRQAAEGHFLLDNRFTTDPQPGLTIHAYFTVLGWVSKFIGYPLTEALARMIFGALAVFLVYRLVRPLTRTVFETKVVMSLVTFGAGFGALVWHDFGIAFDREESMWAVPLMGKGLPIDTWQPEAFFFPSLLTSSLFMVSLCLILFVFDCVLRAKESWKPVLGGAISMALLMNVHSYDVALVTLVLVGFLVMQASRKAVTGAWVLRAAVIGSGAVPPALWFMHVLSQDKVFQARAATLTYSSNFKQILFGLGGLLFLGLYAVYKEANNQVVLHQEPTSTVETNLKAKVGFFGLCALIGIGYIFSSQHVDGYWLMWPAFAAAFLSCLGILYCLATEDEYKNWLLSWSIIGLIAPYIPQLFQRKLGMGLEIPWAILGSIGLAALLMKADRNKRNLATALGLIILCASSIRWLARERLLAANDVSTTTMHAVFQPDELKTFVEYLLANKGPKTAVIAMPGVALPGTLDDGKRVKDTYHSPYMPDLNPFLSGLAGVYTYAGHWSETPDYSKRRTELTRFFLSRFPDSERVETLKKSGAEYIVAPLPESFPKVPELELADVTRFGEVIKKGTRFALIKVNRELLANPPAQSPVSP